MGALQAAGGVMTAGDLEKHETRFVEPISTTYRGIRVYETPPPTQVRSVGRDFWVWMDCVRKGVVGDFCVWINGTDIGCACIANCLVCQRRTCQTTCPV